MVSEKISSRQFESYRVSVNARSPDEALPVFMGNGGVCLQED